MTTINPSVASGMIATKSLAPHPDNLRADLGDLDDLVASIDAVGIIEPIVIDTDNRVLAGHRRLEAAKRAGLSEVPYVMRELADDAEAAEVMLIENLQRTGLNPIEEGTGYERLCSMGLSQREVAERVGCNQSHVSKRIKLVGLPEKARAMIVAGELEISEALELAKLVELDADSAGEWLDDENGYPWPSIAERIRRAEQDIGGFSEPEDEIAGEADENMRQGASVAPTSPAPEPKARELPPLDFAKAPLMAVGGRSFDFAGHRFRVESGYPERTVELIEWVFTAVCQRVAAEGDAEPAPPADDLRARMAAEPPWSAYTEVDEVRLVGGIREHGNADKLRHAIVYEKANADRPIVLAELRKRIEELS